MSKNEKKIALLSTKVYIKYTNEENVKKIPLYTKSKKMHDFGYNWETNIRNRKTAVFFITKMAIINLELSTTDTNRLMTLCEQNVHFVMAKTLTQTAQIAQAEIKQHIRNTFVLRKPNFEKSIKVRPATKQTLTASVYTMAGFATLQQTGGKRYAKDGRLAVPQYETLQQIKATRKSDVPGSFIMKLKSGGIVIAQRKNTEIEILYHIKKLAYVPKRLDMLEIGESTAKTEIPRLFSQNLQSLK